MPDMRPITIPTAWHPLPAHVIGPVAGRVVVVVGGSRSDNSFDPTPGVDPLLSDSGRARSYSTRKNIRPFHTLVNLYSSRPPAPAAERRQSAGSCKASGQAPDRVILPAESGKIGNLVEQWRNEAIMTKMTNLAEFA